MNREGSGFFSAFSTAMAFAWGDALVASRFLVAAIALTGAWGLRAFAGGSEPEIAWVGDLDQAMQLAKIHNKPLMIHFYGDHCPPCRMLEAKAFRNRELVLALNDQVIATKVNADQRRDIAQNYQVTRWPTDVYLHADGTLIERGVSNQDPQAYARTVARVSLKHRDWTLAQVATRETQERREQQVANSDVSKFRNKIFRESSKQTPAVRVSAADWNNQSSASEGQVSLTSVRQAPNVQVINVEEHFAVAGAVLSQEKNNAQQYEVLATQPGLGGFCPVALQDYLRMQPESQAVRSPWVPGKEEFSVRHRGRVYRCASSESRERLLRDPDAFAPVFSGCDLVEFARSGVLVEGKCDLGFIEQNTGRVFLFATRASYEEFARNCERYSNLSDPSQDRMAQGQSATNLR